MADFQNMIDTLIEGDEKKLISWHNLPWMRGFPPRKY